MSKSIELDIATLRFLIGYLGEKSQGNWWPTEFLSSTSEAFLAPVFSKTSRLAQFNGVSEAARRVHDERIGVGRVFHLFRLPELTEQRLFEFLQESGSKLDLKEALDSAGSAMENLQRFTKGAADLHEGPLQVGTVKDLSSHAWISKVAAAYHTAFARQAQIFPYFVERS